MRARHPVRLSGAGLRWVPVGLMAWAVAVCGFLAVVRLQPGGAHVARAVDDLGQLLAAATAAVAAGWRCRRSPPGRARHCWLLLALAVGSWAAGEVVWSWLELFSGHATPFPSPADAGFLAFPALAAAGLLLWPSGRLGTAARWRALLDGALVAGALFILTWTSVLRTVVQGSTDTELGRVVLLAYPVSDLVLLTVTIVFVAQRASMGRGLGLLAVGLACLCVSDSGFAYLTAVDRYATGSPVDAGWFGGFLLIALAASARGPRGADEPADPGGLESTATALLPYAPAVVGLTVATVGVARGTTDQVPLAAAGVVVALLLVRQLLAVLDNRRLVRRLVEAQQALHHRAFHDPLTGLANRALFADRLRHGLDLHRRDLRALSVLYCDLDGFKSVNDSLGHEAGDEVLKAAAERLLAVTRPGDTVARLGGDEFAVLIEDDGDAIEAAARILHAFSQPANVGRHVVPMAASIGVAGLSRDDPAVDAGVLLHRADAAMYQAKRNGKGTVVLWSPAPEPRVSTP